jgi:hypothetical protein
MIPQVARIALSRRRASSHQLGEAMNRASKVTIATTDAATEKRRPSPPGD